MSVRFVAILNIDVCMLYCAPKTRLTQNYPVFLESFGPNVEASARNVRLTHELVCEMALDFVDAQQGRGTMACVSTLLIVYDGIAVYGSLSNTKVKVFVGVDALSLQPDIDEITRRIHELYVEYICNPFYDPTEKTITNSKFRMRVRNIFTGTAAKDRKGTPDHLASVTS